jgi:hypothetical protein
MDGVVGLVTGQVQDISSCIVSTPALGSIQPSVQCISGTLSMWVKEPGHESDHNTA